MADVNLKSYTDTVYHHEDLKSLIRYRFNKICERAKLKSSIASQICILFPKLKKLVPTLHMTSVYTLFSEFSRAKHVAPIHLIHLTNLLHEAFKGRNDWKKVIEIQDVAKKSIGSAMPAKSLKPKHTIHHISKLDKQRLK